ncbi:MAG: response regulator [Haliscomenobacter sp.]|nr:response regulator [Haliscomenobacter sp.]
MHRCAAGHAGTALSEIRIAGIFNDPSWRWKPWKRSKPDLLFLDIEMPRLNGFDFLQRCGNFPMQLIFMTAYDQYAVRAFKFSALDYLLADPPR